MAPIHRIAGGLYGLLLAVTTIYGDIDTSGVFRFQPFEFGAPTNLNTTKLPRCPVDPTTGYVCCDKNLKTVIEGTLKELDEAGSGASKGLGYSKCNLHNMANLMQQRAQHMLGVPIEAIISVGKMAEKLHVVGNMQCKLKVGEKTFLLYAAEAFVPTTTTTTTTPHPLREGCGEAKKKA
uniref:Ground-like domain-containing protein n=1 Tax=Plectus sambesii TaxID=2011161 RepID=A0A914VG01_9BILA